MALDKYREKLITFEGYGANAREVKKAKELCLVFVPSDVYYGYAGMNVIDVHTNDFLSFITSCKIEGY